MGYLTTETAGELLSISPRTIRDLIRRGELPAIRIGSEYRIDETDLQEFITRNRTPVRGPG